MSKRKTTISLSSDIKTKLDKVKSDSTTYNELMEYLLSLDSMLKHSRGLIKAEYQLKRWLVFGYEKKITPSELRKWCNLNLKTCKEAVENHKEQVDLFNKQFK